MMSLIEPWKEIARAILDQTPPVVGLLDLRADNPDTTDFRMAAEAALDGDPEMQRVMGEMAMRALPLLRQGQSIVRELSGERGGCRKDWQSAFTGQQSTGKAPAAALPAKSVQQHGPASKQTARSQVLERSIDGMARSCLALALAFGKPELYCVTYLDTWEQVEGYLVKDLDGGVFVCEEVTKLDACAPGQVGQVFLRSDSQLYLCKGLMKVPPDRQVASMTRVSESLP